MPKSTEPKLSTSIPTNFQSYTPLRGTPSMGYVTVMIAGARLVQQTRAISVLRAYRYVTNY